MIIAIDGPAAAGKGTLSRGLAEAYSLAHLDTGALYRGVAWLVLKGGGDPRDVALSGQIAKSFDIAEVDLTAIRTREVGAAASVVAAQSDVRAALLDYQRRFAQVPPGGAAGAVLDGRDIGTVVCPSADVKLFVTASAEARAHRRWLELRADDPNLAEAVVLEDIKRRDERDADRKDAPMKAAEDAVLLDTSELSIETAFETARSVVDTVLSNR